MHFLDFDLGVAIPDANTIGLFREKLTETGALAMLFPDFDRQIKERCNLAMGGQIVDATVMAAPKKHNIEAEKAAIKEGKKGAEIWRYARCRGLEPPVCHGTAADGKP